MKTPELIAATPRSVAIRLALPGARYHLDPLAWTLGERSGMADRVVLVLDDLEPDTEYDLQVQGFVPLSFQTTECTGKIAASDHPTLQAAIDAVPQGGTLYIPPGDWVSLPLFLKSDMHIYLAEGACLLAPPRTDAWPILPAPYGTWEGEPAPTHGALVTAIGAQNLTIAGPGLIDAGGAIGDWWQWPKGTRNGARRARGLHLINCRDVILMGFTLQNAPSWTIHPQNCEQLQALGLHIKAPHDSPNTDGLNPESSRDVLIEGVRFSVGDDCIAIKSGKRGATTNFPPTERITIRHCLMERGHGGVVIGSEMSGGVSDVTVEHCDMLGTDRGLRLKTRRGRGGYIRNVRMAHVHMNGVKVPFCANAHYHCDADGHDDWVQSRNPATIGPGTPRIDGIHVADVTIENLSVALGAFLGLPESPICNVTLDRIRVLSHNPTALPETPIMADRIRPLRHAGIAAEQAQVTQDGQPIPPLPLTESPMHLLDYADAYATRYVPYKDGDWCYEDGCLYRALVLLHQNTGDQRWLDHLLRLTKPQIAPDGRLAGYSPDEFNIDNILAGRCLFHLADVTGDPRYARAADLLASQLARHPRTPSANYWHKAIYPQQVWLDGLYMALPFQIEYGLNHPDPTLIDDALRQFESALRLTRRPDGLYAHGYDDARQQIWADPITGQNAALWTRSLGWLAMALADAYDLLPDRPQLGAHLTDLLTRLAPLRAPNGLWWQVTDEPNLPGNYPEASASAMIAYAALVAARHHLIPPGLGQAALAALHPQGHPPQLHGICEVAGLGGKALRDGTAAYYLSEPIVADDVKGSGPFLMAIAEALRQAPA
jgi:polygalacturonase/rhamnogalacturonyl hydrolase YesR